MKDTYRGRYQHYSIILGVLLLSTGLNANADADLPDDVRAKLAQVHAERKRIESLLPEFVDSLALPGKPYGRFKFHKAQKQPWLLYASQQMLSLAVRHDYWQQLDEARQQQWLDLLLSAQDPETGLFMCPIESDQPTAYYRAITIKLVRRLHSIDMEPRYPLPKAEKVCPPLDQLDAELNALPWSSRVYAAGSKAGFWGMTRIQELQDQGKSPQDDPYVNKVVTFLESHQNPETGFWGSSPSLLDQMNGFLKTLTVHTSLDRPFPHVEKIIDSVLAVQEPDGSFGDGCSPSNAITILNALCSQTDYRRADIQKAVLRLFDPLATHRQPDGLYSFKKAGCIALHAGVRLCPKPLPISDLVGTSQTLVVIKGIEGFFPED